MAQIGDALNVGFTKIDDKGGGSLSKCAKASEIES